MAASIIEQSPIGQPLPVGQDLIYVVSNTSVVANETRVKFVAEVYIGTSQAAVTPTGNTPVGTFKTTPNNAGVGMFDLRNVVENYVKADNMAADGSAYKTTTTSTTARHPIHLIDKFSLNTNVTRYMCIRFSVEWLDATTAQIESTQINAATKILINGYLKYSDVLFKSGNNFGYSMSRFLLADTDSEFLTNAPTTQYANLEDYGTFSMAHNNNLSLGKIHLSYYDSDGSFLIDEFIDRNLANGAWSTYGTTSDKQILHFGCFPGNLQNWASGFHSSYTRNNTRWLYYSSSLRLRS
jgi:hypothetical protein